MVYSEHSRERMDMTSLYARLLAGVSYAQVILKLIHGADGAVGICFMNDDGWPTQFSYLCHVFA